MWLWKFFLAVFLRNLLDNFVKLFRKMFVMVPNLIFMKFLTIWRNYFGFWKLQGNCSVSVRIDIWFTEYNAVRNAPKCLRQSFFVLINYREFCNTQLVRIGGATIKRFSFASWRLQIFEKVAYFDEINNSFMDVEIPRPAVFGLFTNVVYANIYFTKTSVMFLFLITWKQ